MPLLPAVGLLVPPKLLLLLLLAWGESLALELAGELLVWLGEAGW
jgi:hypothetical protein